MTRAKALTARFARGWRQRDPAPDAAEAAARAMRDASPEDWARYGGGLLAPDLAEPRAPLHPVHIDEGMSDAGHDLSATA